MLGYRRKKQIKILVSKVLYKILRNFFSDSSGKTKSMIFGQTLPQDPGSLDPTPC